MRFWKSWVRRCLQGPCFRSWCFSTVRDSGSWSRWKDCSWCALAGPCDRILLFWRWWCASSWRIRPPSGRSGWLGRKGGTEDELLRLLENLLLRHLAPCLLLLLSIINRAHPSQIYFKNSPQIPFPPLLQPTVHKAEIFDYFISSWGWVGKYTWSNSSDYDMITVVYSNVW